MVMIKVTRLCGCGSLLSVTNPSSSRFVLFTIHTYKEYLPLRDDGPSHTIYKYKYILFVLLCNNTKNFYLMYIFLETLNNNKQLN